MKDDRFIGTAKVGPKGQIVIPKEIRDLFDIKSGDTLIVLAQKEKGIVVQKSDKLNEIVGQIIDGLGD